jgi:beta-lactamase class C
MRSAVEATHVGYFRVADMTQGLGWEQYAWPTSEEQLLRGNSDDMIGRPNPVVALTPAASNGARLFNKTGSTGGFGTYVVFVPSLRLGIVLLANKNYPIPARVDAAYKILHELVSDQNK